MVVWRILSLQRLAKTNPISVQTYICWEPFVALLHSIFLFAPSDRLQYVGISCILILFNGKKAPFQFKVCIKWGIKLYERTGTIVIHFSLLIFLSDDVWISGAVLAFCHFIILQVYTLKFKWESVIPWIRGSEPQIKNSSVLWEFKAVLNRRGLSFTHHLQWVKQISRWKVKWWQASFPFWFLIAPVGRSIKGLLCEFRLEICFELISFRYIQEGFCGKMMTTMYFQLQS